MTLGPAMTARTIPVGDEGAHRRIALHLAREDDARLQGAVREAELALGTAAAKVYAPGGPDDREEARTHALAALERLAAARTDVVIVAAAISRLGGAR